jgi:hypothetical protein
MWGLVTTCPQFSQNGEDTPLTAGHVCDLQRSISGYHYPWLKHFVDAAIFLGSEVIQDLRDHSRIEHQAGMALCLRACANRDVACPRPNSSRSWLERHRSSSTAGERSMAPQDRPPRRIYTSGRSPLQDEQRIMDTTHKIGIRHSDGGSSA